MAENVAIEANPQRGNYFSKVLRDPARFIFQNGPAYSNPTSIAFKGCSLLRRMCLAIPPMRGKLFPTFWDFLACFLFELAIHVINYILVGGAEIGVTAKPRQIFKFCCCFFYNSIVKEFSGFVKEKLVQMVEILTHDWLSPLE